MGCWYGKLDRRRRQTHPTSMTFSSFDLKLKYEKENLSDYILAIQTMFVLLHNFSIRRVMIKDTYDFNFTCHFLLFDVGLEGGGVVIL